MRRVLQLARSIALPGQCVHATWQLRNCDARDSGQSSKLCRTEPAGRIAARRKLANGFTVLQRLQESDSLSHIPVIVLTARDPIGNEGRCLDGGATAFFQKPVDNNELLEMIRASLQSASAWGPTLPS